MISFFFLAWRFAMNAHNLRRVSTSFSPGQIKIFQIENDDEIASTVVVMLEVSVDILRHKNSMSPVSSQENSGPPGEVFASSRILVTREHFSKETSDQEEEGQRQQDE